MRTIKILLILSVLSCVCLAQDLEKQARSEVTKALGKKMISVQDLSGYFEKINEGKADEVLKALKALELEAIALKAGDASEKNPVGWRMNGTGRFPDATPPLKWSVNLAGKVENIAWMTLLPSDSACSPIVVGDKVFVNSFPYDLICVDKKKGKILWAKASSPYDAATKEDRAKAADKFKTLDNLASKRDNILKQFSYDTNSIIELEQEKKDIENAMKRILLEVDAVKYRDGTDYGSANSTPTSDGKYVYVWYGSGVTACYDLEGNRKWIMLEQRKDQEHGYYSSPLLIGDKLITFMYSHIGLDKETGKIVWESEDFRTAPYVLRWGSSVHTQMNGVDIFVACGGSLFRAKDGKAIYSFKSGNTGVSPIVTDNGYVVFEKSHNSRWFYKLPGTISDISSISHQEISTEKRNIEFEEYKQAKIWESSSYSSPLNYEGLVYYVTGIGTLLVYDLEKNTLVYRKPLGIEVDHANGRPYRSGLEASPTMAGKYIYIWGNEGTTVIIEPGRVFKEVARNKISRILKLEYKSAQEGTISSPFFQGKQMFYRAERYLYCIGEPVR